MTTRPSTRWAVVAVTLATLAAPGSFAAKLVPTVHENEAVTIRAGISDLASRVVEFGSVQELVIAVTYDPQRVTVESLDAEFFTSAWPPEKGAFLLEWTADQAAAGGARTLQARYRFQLLGCPNGGLTCAGAREFPVPEFMLDYQLDPDGGTARTVTFRPWPSALLVAPAIPMDEDGKLYPFEEYFPTGAYPAPLSPSTSPRVSLALFAFGAVALLGGLLMWPFRSRKHQAIAAGGMKRWQVTLQDLDSGAELDEPRVFDRLRRGVVWYCLDELDIDPYQWVDGSLEPVAPDADADLIELRRLFLDVLQNEPGQAAALQERFATFAGRR
ncbi:MAG TPA: hypothetical protein VHG33_06555 [Woeseiaceae bacterium]|nr:hypothetical protein [Woeseiaceae bacterium]